VLLAADMLLYSSARGVQAVHGHMDELLNKQYSNCAGTARVVTSWWRRWSRQCRWQRRRCLTRAKPGAPAQGLQQQQQQHGVCFAVIFKVSGKLRQVCTPWGIATSGACNDVQVTCCGSSTHAVPCGDFSCLCGILYAALSHSHALRLLTSRILLQHLPRHNCHLFRLLCQGSAHLPMFKTAPARCCSAHHTIVRA
jgi:hypothetical protein